MIDYAEGSGKQYHTGVGPDDIGKLMISERPAVLTIVKSTNALRL